MVKPVLLKCWSNEMKKILIYIFVGLGLLNINLAEASDQYFSDISSKKCSMQSDSCFKAVYTNGLRKLDSQLREVSTHFDDASQIYIVFNQQQVAWKNFIEKDCRVIEKITGIRFYGCLIERLDERYKLALELGSV